jgi:hypothetical protein
MANLTITVNDELLEQAQRKALERGTSVDAVLSEYLESFAGTAPEQAVQAVLELSRQAGSAHHGKRWTRDELHDR